MASWFDNQNQAIQPTFEELEEIVKTPLWPVCIEHLRQVCKTEPKLEYSGSSMQPGWSVKYRKSGKPFCTLYPMDGYFIALVVIEAKEMQAAELLIPACSDYIRRLFHGTTTKQGQKRLMIDVTKDDILQDVFRLISLRIEAKHT